MNKTQLQHTSVKIKLQAESASSKTAASFFPPTTFDIVASREKESLFKNRLITIGSIRIATDMIATIPQEFFINERLVVTVRRDSFTEEPTSGTKLLIANRAVLIDKESTLWAIVFL